MSAHTLSSDLVNGDGFEWGMGIFSCEDDDDELGIRVCTEVVVEIELEGNIWIGRSGIKLGSKRESCQYRRVASSKGILVPPPAMSKQKRACARRFSCTPPILDMIRRQRSRASGVVQKVTFGLVGFSSLLGFIRSCISCKRPLPISCNNWFVNALECLIRSSGKSLMSVSMMPLEELEGSGGVCVDLDFLGFDISVFFCFFHSRYSGGGRKRLLASSMEVGNGTWVRSEMRAMRIDKSRLMF